MKALAGAESKMFRPTGRLDRLDRVMEKEKQSRPSRALILRSLRMLTTIDGTR